MLLSGSKITVDLIYQAIFPHSRPVAQGRTQGERVNFYDLMEGCYLYDLTEWRWLSRMNSPIAHIISLIFFSC